MNYQKYVVLALAAGLTGCASGPEPIALSLEQLGAETRSKNYGSADDFVWGARKTKSKFTRTAVNVTGLSLPLATGELVSSPWSEVPENMAVPYRTGCSLIVETMYDTGKPDAEMQAAIAAVSTALRTLNAAAAEKAALDYRYGVASFGYNRVVQLGQEKALKDETVAIIAKALSLTLPANGQPSLADLFKAEQESSRVLAGQADAKYSVLTRDLQKVGTIPNMIVTRWTTSSDNQHRGGMGSIFSVDRSRQDSRSGYAILADIKITSLVPGDDLAYRIYADRKSYLGRSGSDTVFGEPSIVTYTLSAKHVSYLEDRNYTQVITSSLNLSPAEIAKISAGDLGELLKQQSIKLETYTRQAAAMGGNGLVSLPQRKYYKFNFARDTPRYLATQAQSARMTAYNVVYSNRTTLEIANRRVVAPVGRSGDYNPYECGTQFSDFTQELDFSKVNGTKDRPDELSQFDRPSPDRLKGSINLLH